MQRTLLDNVKLVVSSLALHAFSRGRVCGVGHDFLWMGKFLLRHELPSMTPWPRAYACLLFFGLLFSFFESSNLTGLLNGALCSTKLPTEMFWRKNCNTFENY